MPLRLEPGLSGTGVELLTETGKVEGRNSPEEVTGTAWVCSAFHSSSLPFHLILRQWLVERPDVSSRPPPLKMDRNLDVLSDESLSKENKRVGVKACMLAA